jgi:hypothetical protein
MTDPTLRYACGCGWTSGPLSPALPSLWSRGGVLCAAAAGVLHPYAGQPYEAAILHAHDCRRPWRSMTGPHTNTFNAAKREMRA